MFSFERRLQRLRLFLPFVLCAASVRVLAQCPSTTSISPSIREIRVGEEAFLRCQDQDGFSVTSPRFFRDGVLVQIGGRVDNSGSGQIRVSSVQISDEGEYTCLPASSAGCNEAIQSTIGTVLGTIHAMHILHYFINQYAFTVLYGTISPYNMLGTHST